MVCKVERAGEKGWLRNSTVIVAPANQVVEYALYEGNSSLVKLHDLVVRLKLVEIKHGVHLCVTHVSRKRIQNRGIDGISRGSLRTGATVGEQIIGY